jgi:putative peptidoglycan lipid II flippase
LSYGNKLVALGLGIGALALGTSVLPHFSQMAAAADWRGIRRTLTVSSGLILVASVPTVLLLAALSRPIVVLVFQRGSFSAHDAHLVSRIQACYLLQVPFYLLSIVGVRLLSALQRNRIIMWIAFANVILNGILAYVLMHWIGVAGIALSTSFVYLFSTSIVFAILFRFLGSAMRAHPIPPAANGEGS